MSARSDVLHAEVRKLREHADVLERRADALEIRDRNQEGVRPEVEPDALDLDIEASEDVLLERERRYAESKGVRRSESGDD